MVPDQIVAIFELLLLLGCFILSAVNALLLKMYNIPNSVNRLSEVYLEVLTCSIYSPIPMLRLLQVDLDMVFTIIAAYLSIWVFFVTLNASIIKHFGILLVVANPGQYSGLCPLLNVACLLITATLSAVQCLVFWGKYGLHTSGLYAAFTVRDSDSSIIFPFLSFMILYLCTHIVFTSLLNCRMKLAPYVGHENQMLLRNFFIRFWLNRVISWSLIVMLPLVDTLIETGVPWGYHVTSVLLCKCGMLARMVQLLIDIQQINSKYNLPPQYNSTDPPPHR